MIDFVVQHPVIILYLAGAWFIAACISAMPPLPENQNYFVKWAYGIAQVVGANLDKVGHAALESKQFKQVENTLQTTDAGRTQLETSKVTTQTAEPVASPKP